MGVVGNNAHGPEEQKFLRCFFQKAAAFFAWGGNSRDLLV
jgi:hypothetical protein